MARATLALVFTLLTFVGAGAAIGATRSTVVLTAKLTGKYLHASPRGSGTARVSFTGNRVCWKLTFKGIDKPRDSGIHVAPPPAAGKHSRSILPFTASTSTKPGCVTGSPGWIKKILANPGGFYVHITTLQYRNGAIGGPLKLAS